MKTLLPLLLLAFSGALRAQSGELWLSGGASILANRNIGSPFSDGQSSDVRLGDGFRIGARFAFNSAGHIGHENPVRVQLDRPRFLEPLRLSPSWPESARSSSSEPAQC